MPKPSLFESAGLWAGIGSGVAAVGGVFVGVGIAQVVSTTPAPTVWSNVAFDVGLSVMAFGVLGLAWALVLNVAHHHLERHDGLASAGPPAAGPPLSPSAADLDVRGLERIRTESYAANDGIFLVHTWNPSTKPGQKADVILRLQHHPEGTGLPATIESVEYVVGERFDALVQGTVHRQDNFATKVSIYASLLVLARVCFSDRRPPLLLKRYLNIDESTSSGPDGPTSPENQERIASAMKLLEPLAGSVEPGTARSRVYQTVVTVALNGEVPLDVVEIRAVLETMYRGAERRDPPIDWFEVRELPEGRGWEVVLPAAAFGKVMRRTEADARAMRQWLRSLLTIVRER
jgi:hypothetical protein